MFTPDTGGRELVDRHGRTIRYLRLSVTDRCNFRCAYCVGQHEFTHLPPEETLRYEEMLFAATVFARLGVKKIRVTGGEPLVRKDLPDLLSMLNGIDGIEEVTLTTNASLLDRHAAAIKQAGINRINVSLDSLKPERHEKITGGFSLDAVLKGIAAAQRAGITRIKANTVAIKGFNDDEILDFCEFAKTANITIRFIEFMPIGNSTEWNDKSIITGEEILARIREKYTTTPLERENLAGPATNFRLDNGATIGIITPISNHFCADCDKLRLTADGKLRPCLLSDADYDLKPAIRSGDAEKLEHEIRTALSVKDEAHAIKKGKPHGPYKRIMPQIGG